MRNVATAVRTVTVAPNLIPPPTRAPEVDMATCRIIHPDGTIDPRVHMLGIPLQEMRADTTISPMPGTDPLMLQETDAAAASALGVARG